MPSIPNKKQPKLVNRGAAGLLTKTPAKQKPAPAKAIEAVINKIDPALKHLATDIGTLTPDPNNARLHPERNMESIKESLSLYGQVKPIVVRKQTRVVVAGNGTLQAAKEMGWTKIAAVITDLNEVDAMGYGLADNRSAEMAKWDFEVVARLDRLMSEAGHDGRPGWSMDELEVLRMADWTPPSTDTSEFGGGGVKTLDLNEEQLATVREIIGAMMARDDHMASSEAECLVDICKEWGEAQ